MNNFLETLFNTLVFIILACGIFGIDVDRLEAAVEFLIRVEAVRAMQKKDDND
jgi:hypothetical protein